jgi:hypothetical protein
MKKTGIILILILTANFLWAEYSPKKLYEMAVKADKILYGTIIELDSSKYKLRIEGSLTGENGTISIVRFTDWTCAHRWTEYQIGQRLFVFLVEKNGDYFTISGGNEGELPIQNDSVFIGGLSLKPPPPLLSNDRKNDTILIPKSEELEYFEYGLHIVYKSEYRGQPIEQGCFLKTIRDIRNCFDFDYGDYNDIINGHIKCSEKDIKQKMESNKILRWTHQELIK